MRRNEKTNPKPGQRHTEPGVQPAKGKPSGDKRRRAEEDLSRSQVEMTQSERLLLALSHAAQGVQRARTLEAVYRAVGDEVLQLGLIAVLLTMTDDRRHLAVAYHTIKSALLSVLEKRVGLSAQTLRIQIEPGGFYDQILTGGRTVYFESSAEHITEVVPRLAGPLSRVLVSLLGIRQAIYAPLRVGGEAYGVLIVTGGRLSEADTPAVTAFATQAAIAVENARLYQEAQQRAETLRQAQVEIQRQKQYWETLVQNIPVAVVIMDPQERIASCNPAFETLFGYAQAEVVGQNLDQLVVSDEAGRSEATAYTRQALEGASVHTQTKRRRKDGTEVDVELFALPVRVDGQQVGAVGLYHDISELVRARRKAESADRAKSEFLANMSHEIRTPMNGVIGMLELALDTSLTSEQREYLSSSLQSAEALLALINDILDISKIEAQGVELEKIDFDLRSTVEDVAYTLAKRAQDKGLELACLIHPDLIVKLRGDPARLRQILINLVGNAIKFTHQGEIVVRAEPTAETETHVTIRFAVQDTGIGIPHERQKAIFERFTQADGSTTRKYGGTGLGLPICKQLVEAMGGQIWIESTVGVGSTFWFTITFEKQAGDAQAVAPLVLEPVELKDLRLLGVDDNATNCTILTRMAEGFGCRIETVGNGAKALEILQNASRSGDPFRVVLLDMQMRGMDGEQTVRAIKSDPAVREVKIIILTSIGQRGDAARLEALGVAGYLLKPLRQQMLREALIAVLGRKEEGRPILITRHVLSEQKRQGLRLLLAEDNPINQRLAVILLQKAGFSVDTVENGAQALEQVQKKHYNAVLMDVQMPEMDGFEATTRIRQLEGRAGHIPIIAMTAGALKGDRERCLEAGMDDYVSKPLDPPTLMKIIDQWTQPGTKNSLRAEAAPNSEVQDYADRLVTSPFVEADLATEGGLFGEEIQEVVSTLPTPVQAVKQAVLETELPVDIRSAMVRFEGDRSFFLEMVHEFTEHLAGRMLEMKAALEAGDANGLSRHAHNLKGVAANFSAEPLVRLAKELETSGQQEDLAEAPALLSALQAESERVRQFCADIESKIKSLGY